MKNQDKASLPKIQIKQVQVLNRVIANNTVKGGNQAGANGVAGYNSTETVTNTMTGIF